MITYSIIQKSQLEGAKRLDAEYYQLEYLNLRNRLKKSGNVSTFFKKLVRNPMAYGFNYKKEGIPYFRIDDLLSPLLSENPVYISQDVQNKLKSTQVKKGDLIMAVRGSTIGRLGLYLDESPANVSPNVIILRPKDIKWSKY